jgi:hypothetical protein
MTFSVAADGIETWCDTAEPARRFDNILFNKAYMTVVDQCARGRGFHQQEDFVCNLIANDRVIYVRDDSTGEYFSVGYAPVWKPYTSYRCRGGLGYQIIENTTNGLRCTWRIYVPAGNDPVEVWDLRIEDVSGKERKLSVFTAAQMTCDGVDLYGGSLYRIARYVPEVNAIYVLMDAPRH